MQLQAGGEEAVSVFKQQATPPLGRAVQSPNSIVSFPLDMTVDDCFLGSLCAHYRSRVHPTFQQRAPLQL